MNHKFGKANLLFLKYLFHNLDTHYNVTKIMADPSNPITPETILSNPRCLTTDGLSLVLNELGVKKTIIKPAIIIEPPIISGTIFI